MSNSHELGAGKCIKQTKKAILVKLDSGPELWIPQAVVHEDSEVWQLNHVGKVLVEAWWAEQENL